MSEELLALDGRALGKRGTRTRRKLLDATARLLESEGLRNLRVVEIARSVGTSPATFYQYFRDVEDAVLALAEEAGTDTVALAATLDGEWEGGAGLDSARALISGFVDVWDRHRAVLRTRNLAAEEGDPRFREVRRRTLTPFTDRLAALVRKHQKAGKVSEGISASAAAPALVALIERVAEFQRDLEQLGIPRRDVVETTAHMVFQTVTGSA